MDKSVFLIDVVLFNIRLEIMDKYMVRKIFLNIMMLRISLVFGLVVFFKLMSIFVIIVFDEIVMIFVRMRIFRKEKLVINL